MGEPETYTLSHTQACEAAKLVIQKKGQGWEGTVQMLRETESSEHLERGFGLIVVTAC